MLEWEGTESGFRVHDSAGAECSVSGSQLEFTDADRELPRPVDITLDCVTAELTLPGAVVYVISLSSGETEELDADTEPTVETYPLAETPLTTLGEWVEHTRQKRGWKTVRVDSSLADAAAATLGGVA